jgi:hypothetical protein
MMSTLRRPAWLRLGLFELSADNRKFGQPTILDTDSQEGKSLSHERADALGIVGFIAIPFPFSLSRAGILVRPSFPGAKVQGSVKLALLWPLALRP